jgi:hypothetical protein
MREIHLTERHRSDEWLEAHAGRMIQEDEFHTVLTEDADVYKPDGTPLAKFRKGVIPKNLCVKAFKALRSAARTSDNRGLAAGYAKKSELGDRGRGKVVKKEGSTRFQQIKEDGTVSNTSRAKPVQSGIVGYFDRAPRYPYCRETAWNLDKPGAWRAALPYVQAVNEIFREEMPRRYAAQQAKVEETHPNWVINDTAFTTITVNSDFRTALHTDKGDLKEGFGVMSALRSGHFDGCFTGWPGFGVAADMHTGDVLLGDVHEWHCNTPMKGIPGQFTRLSCVFYYRRRMDACGSPEEETERAQEQRDYTDV